MAFIKNLFHKDHSKDAEKQKEKDLHDSHSTPALHSSSSSSALSSSSLASTSSSSSSSSTLVSHPGLAASGAAPTVNPYREGSYGLQPTTQSYAQAPASTFINPDSTSTSTSTSVGPTTSSDSHLTHKPHLHDSYSSSSSSSTWDDSKKHKLVDSENRLGHTGDHTYATSGSSGSGFTGTSSSGTGAHLGSSHHHGGSSHSHLGSSSSSSFSTSSATSGLATATTHEQKMILSEEKLQVNKSAHAAGGVDIEKTIEREHASVPVTLEREVVTIERRPVSGATLARAGAATGDVATAHMGHTGTHDTMHGGSMHGATSGGAVADSHFGALSGFGNQQVIHETVHAEQAIAHKKIAPREELQVSKQSVGQVETVRGTVRSEHVDVKHDVGNVDAVRWDHAHGSSSASSSSSAGAGVGAVAGGATHGHGSGSILDSNGRVVAFEERLAIGKERVAAGEVQVTKHVETSTVAKPVTLMHDELQVTRHAFDGRSHDGASSSLLATSAIPSSLTEGVAHIGLTREKATASTVVVPKEEIIVRKGVARDQEMVTTELLKERIDIQPSQGAYTETATTAAHTMGTLGTHHSGTHHGGMMDMAKAHTGHTGHSGAGVTHTTHGDKFAPTSSSSSIAHQPSTSSSAAAPRTTGY